MATNKDYLNSVGYCELFRAIDSRYSDSQDSSQNKFGCVLELVTGHTVECFGSGCAECIRTWLEDEYDGTYDVEVY